MPPDPPLQTQLIQINKLNRLISFFNQLFVQIPIATPLGAHSLYI